MLFGLIFNRHKFELLLHVRQNLHGALNLLVKLLKILVSLINLLVISLVLNLQLLEVDEIQTLDHLFFFFQQELALFELCFVFDVVKTGSLELFVLFTLLLFQISDILDQIVGKTF